MIKLASPDIRDSDIDRCIQVIRSGNLVQGEQVAQFESALCDFSGLSAAAVVTSATAALHLVLKALDIQPGDTVIVPGFTFPATANAVENTGASVIFCDVDASSYVATPAAIERAILSNRDKRLKAIILVHEFGYPAQAQAIRKLADQHGLYLIEDAACALGTVADHGHAGTHSHAACFSFHPRKAITTGEGGAVLSQHASLIEKIKKYRNHGIAVADGRIDFELAGLNCRMTDFQAALAIGQLARFRQELEKRRQLAEIYLQQLQGAPSIRLPASHPGHSWQSFMLVLDEAVDRAELIARLKVERIETNIGAQALHALCYYRDKYTLEPPDFPISLQLYQAGLVLPLYGKLEQSDIEYIADRLAHSLGQ